MPNLREELANVVENYPLFAGDTVSHRGAKACAEQGWIVRQADGRWIPTREGLEEYWRCPVGEDSNDA